MVVQYRVGQPRTVNGQAHAPTPKAGEMILNSWWEAARAMQSFLEYEQKQCFLSQKASIHPCKGYACASRSLITVSVGQRFTIIGGPLSADLFVAPGPSLLLNIWTALILLRTIVLLRICQSLTKEKRKP